MSTTQPHARWGRVLFGAIVASVAIVATLYLAGIVPGFGGGAKPSNSASAQVVVTPTATPSASPGKSVPEVSANVEITNPDAQCPAENKFDASSLSAPGDFVSTANVSKTLKEQIAANCSQPTVLDQTIKGMQNIPGFTAANPWVNTWNQKVGTVSASNWDGLNQFVAYESATNHTVVLNNEYTHYAEMVNELLLKFKTSQTSEKALIDYHVEPAAKLMIHQFNSTSYTNVLPQATVDNGQPDALPALKLSYIYKTGGCAFSMGFNLEDKRFEWFGNDCVKPSSTSSTTTPPKTTTTPPQGTPPKGTPPKTTPPPKGHTPTCAEEGKKGTYPNCWTPCPANPSVPNTTPGCSKNPADSVTPPAGVNKQPNDPYETTPAKPSNPAPVIKPSPAPVSTSPAQGSKPVPSTQPAPVATVAPSQGSGSGNNTQCSTNPYTGASDCG